MVQLGPFLLQLGAILTHLGRILAPIFGEILAQNQERRSKSAPSRPKTPQNHNFDDFQLAKPPFLTIFQVYFSICFQRFCQPLSEEIIVSKRDSNDIVERTIK